MLETILFFGLFGFLAMFFLIFALFKIFNPEKADEIFEPDPCLVEKMEEESEDTHLRYAGIRPGYVDYYYDDD